MDHCHIGLQKADLRLEQCERGLFEASTQQTRMVFFKIGSAVKPVGTDVNEICRKETPERESEISSVFGET